MYSYDVCWVFITWYLQGVSLKVHTYLINLPPSVMICMAIAVLSPHLQKGTTALFIAVGANNYNAVINLVNKGANVNARRVRKLK